MTGFCTECGWTKTQPQHIFQEARKWWLVTRSTSETRGWIFLSRGPKNLGEIRSCVLKCVRTCERRNGREADVRWNSPALFPVLSTQPSFLLSFTANRINPCSTSSPPRPPASLFFPPFYSEMFSSPRSHTPETTHTHISIYTVYVQMNTKRAKPLRHSHTRRPANASRDVCLCVTDAVLNKSTSLPRELSAIADLNLHSAASSFWTAAAAVTKQVHFFFFFRNKPGSLSRALWEPFECTQRRVFTQPGHTLRVHVNTFLPQNHATEWGWGGAYMIMATLNDYFLSCLWCRRVEMICWTVSHLFSTINI